MRQPVVVGRELEEAHGSVELRLGMRVQLGPVYPGMLSFYNFKKNEYHSYAQRRPRERWVPFSVMLFRGKEARISSGS